MRRIGYVRTSKDTQLTDRQKMELEKDCDFVVVEDGVSARAKDRPVFKELLARLKQGDVLVTISFDRAFRSVVEGLQSLDDLTRRGVSLESLSQRIDPTTPDGRMMFSMILVVAEWEVNMLSWRTIHGLKAAMARGVKLGRPRKGFEKSKALKRKKNAKSTTSIDDLDSLFAA